MKPSPPPSNHPVEAPAGPNASTPKLLARVPMHVRWRDLDAFNHVNNSSYLTYLEEARLIWLKDIPGPWYDEHAVPVMVASELNYRAPIAWPAETMVELYCERIGRSSLSISHRIVEVGADSTPQLYCDGRIVLVWMDPAGGKSVPLPEAVRDACRHGQDTIPI